MAWTVEISDLAERQLRKLDRSMQKCILDWLDDRIDVLVLTIGHRREIYNRI